MRYLVEIIEGPCKQRCIELPLNLEFSFGSTDLARIALYKDTHLSNRHFSMTCDGQYFHLRDLNSKSGTFIHGLNLSDVVNSFGLENGDQFTAGQSTFRVRIENTSVLEILRERTDYLFAIVDTARDERILPLLKASNNPYQSLFEGVRARWLEEFTPYLVSLPKRSSLLEQLVHLGWGNRWGVYLSSRQTFQTLMSRMRQFLWVQTEAREKLYFRFYDPNILQVFLFISTSKQANELFRDVSSYLMEAKKPEFLVKFTYGVRGVELQAFPVSVFTSPQGDN